MSEPRRLMIDDGTSDEMREMLRAWDALGPSDDARKKTFAALGIAATGAAALGLAAGAGKIASGSIAPKAVGLGAAALLKWIALGGAIVGTTVVTTVFATRASDPRPIVVEPAPVAPAVAIHAAMRAVAETATNAPAPSATAAVPSAPASVASAPSSAVPAASGVASAPPAPSAPTLADELALVDSARTMLASGDYDAAIRFVDQYEARFPRGAFTHEAEVVRIDALARSGRRAAASAAAKRFVAAYPSSPHAARIRALIVDAP